MLHWISEPDRVIANVYAALRHGGRFVAEFGGHRCVETIRTALIAELDVRGHDGKAADPWFFPTAEDYGSRLRNAGFEVETIEVFPRPTPLPGDITGFLETFAGSFASVLPVEARAEYIDAVRERLKPVLCAVSGEWTADYTRLCFRARKD